MTAHDSAHHAHEHHGLTESVYNAVIDALVSDNLKALPEILAPLHPSDIAELIERLMPDQRLFIVESAPKDILGEVIAETSEGVQEAILRDLSRKDLRTALRQLDSDDAADLVQRLDDERLPEIERIITKDEDALTRHKEDTAGSLMRVELLKVSVDWTVGDVLKHLRTYDTDKLPEALHSIYIVSEGNALLGSISLIRVVHLPPKSKLVDVMRQNTYRLHVSCKIEEVIDMFEKYDLIDCAVVDDHNHLIGMITVDDVIDAVEEGHEKELMRRAGLAEAQDMFAPVRVTTRQRLPWLTLNVFTAAIGSMVIAVFEQEIAQLVALAVLMPIIASMGGNAGTQTMTVTVRALAMDKITRQNAMALLKKEIMVGSLNGMCLAMIMCAGSYAIYEQPVLSLVIALSTVFVHVLGPVAGYIIPVTLEKIGKDPAVSSGVLLTTVTDVGGFFTFLGLASLLLL